MKKENLEYIHSWFVLVMTFFSLIFLLINHRLILNTSLLLFCFFFYFKNGLKLKVFIKILSYAFLFSFGIFLLNFLHPAKVVQIGRPLQTMMKVFLVSLLSMSSGVVIDYTKVVSYLMVHKGLKLFLGYPLLLAMNSIALFKDEYERIRLNVKLRELPFFDRLNIFFPLLVFAIRHSQRGALTLVSRGLNDKKTFYFSYDVSMQDRKNLIFFWIFYLALVGMAFFWVG